MNYTSLTEQTGIYITEIFKASTSNMMFYHNLKHTEQVVAHAARIAKHYKLNDRDLFIVSAAAWFHDIGYNLGEAKGHEMAGADMAEAFLKSQGVDESTILAIRHCILSTRLPQQPANLYEQIVCDADLFHFGTDGFAESNKLMRKEAEARIGRKIPKAEWRQGTIKLLESHHFHTDYSRHLLNDKKQEHLEKLKLRAQEEGLPASQVTAPEDHSVKTIDPLPLKKPNAERPDKGIETMFRISSNNHQRLSDMADNKAHIMVTTTSIIISVLLSVLLRKLEDNPYLILPTMMLLFVCLVTMVFSILATRPTIPPGTFTREDIDAKKVNLLFFGNFYRMPLEEYAEGMQKMMNDREFLYGSLIRDVYSQGIVLGRKYRLLRIAYNVFMFGIVISVVAFAMSSILFAH